MENKNIITYETQYSKLVIEFPDDADIEEWKRILRTILMQATFATSMKNDIFPEV